jgi:hypothetical protein
MFRSIHVRATSIHLHHMKYHQNSDQATLPSCGRITTDYGRTPYQTRAVIQNTCTVRGQSSTRARAPRLRLRSTNSRTSHLPLPPSNWQLTGVQRFLSNSLKRSQSPPFLPIPTPEFHSLAAMSPFASETKQDHREGAGCGRSAANPTRTPPSSTSTSTSRCYSTCAPEINLPQDCHLRAASTSRQTAWHTPLRVRGHKRCEHILRRRLRNPITLPGEALPESGRIGYKAAQIPIPRPDLIGRSISRRRRGLTPPR